MFVKMLLDGERCPYVCEISLQIHSRPKINENSKRVHLPLFDSQISISTEDVLSGSPKLSGNSDNNRVGISIVRTTLHLLSRYQINISLPSSPSNIISHLDPLLPQMWSIWECITLGEPVLIIGPTPDIVSGLIWWLRELSRPVRVLSR